MKALLIPSALVLAFAASPGWAQTTEPAPSSTQTPTSIEATGLEDVVVTAQRRGENLQRAAIAVTAVTSEVLTAQVTTSENLGKLVPSIVIGGGGGGSNLVAIRGIGTLASNGLSENVVAFNLNGVYLSRPAAASGIYYDLERVEVLKGPQGTLYGRNATAGAINIISKRPTFTPGGDLSVQLGNYDLVQGQGAVNLPLSDTVAVRLAGQAIKRDGYFTDGYNDQDQYSGRASVLFRPSDDLNMLLTADFTHIGGKGAAGVLSPYVDPSNPYLGPSEPAGVAPYAGFPPFALPLPLDDGFSDIDIWGVTGNLDWNVGGGTLTVLPSYRRSEIDYKHYAAGFPVTTRDETSDETTLEVRYATSEDRRLRGIVGGYYFNETGGFLLSFETLPAFIQPSSVTDIEKYETTSLAAFGQATYDLTQHLRLIGGLRYSNEDKTVRGTSNGGAPVVGDLSNDNVSWRVGLEADVAENSLVYATVATGFKAGGFYSSASPNTFEPEKLTAYTIGTKNRFLNNNLQFNVEAYYWKYEDKQVTHVGPVRPTGFDLITENAGEATLYGAEVEVRWLATQDDLFSINLLYNHTNYDSFVYNQTILTGPPTTTCDILPPTAGQAATTVNIDCSGNVLQQAPQWALNGDYSHTFDLGNNSELVFHVAGKYRSSYWLGDEQLPGQQQEAYVTGDVDLTYSPASARWHASAYVENVGDEAVRSQSFVQPILGQPVVGLYPPRTYGVRLGVNF